MQALSSLSDSGTPAAGVHFPVPHSGEQGACWEQGLQRAWEVWPHLPIVEGALVLVIGEMFFLFFVGHAVAEEEARKAHQLWLSVEALKYSMKTASAEQPTVPLGGAVEAIRASCADSEFAQALTAAIPPESLTRGVYSEETLRVRFYDVRKLARRVAMIDETRNSLYQYFLSYLQSLLLSPPQQLKPPAELRPEDINTFKLLSYASYCIEHGDLELAAKFVNQLKGESRRVAQDWLKEARMTLETKQVVEILTAYASAVGIGTTQAQQEQAQ